MPYVRRVAALRPVVDVSDWELVGVEPTGLDEKAWLSDPADRSPWLFKPLPHQKGQQSGEDWAEVIAADLAELVGIPHPVVEFARREDTPGCIVKKFMDREWELQPGSALLSEVVDDFNPRHPDRLGHSLSNIEAVTASLAAPSRESSTGLSAFGYFAGYLVFDALIANQDRHSNNWGVLRPPPGTHADELAPSFDHGSSLGFNVAELERTVRLQSGTVRAWACRGSPHHFEHVRGRPRRSLVELAAEALRRAGEAARGYWLQGVEELSADAVERAVRSAPNLSEATANFVVALVSTNRERILDEC